MAHSIRAQLLFLLGLGSMAANGCATGELLERGRRVERPIAYERARSDGERIYLAYRSELRSAHGEVVTRRERGVVVRISDLEPLDTHPLDDFPLEHQAESEWPADGLQELAIVGADSFLGTTGPRLVVETHDGRPTGFVIEALEAGSNGSVFRSGALVERETAAWVWAVFPFAAAYDAVAIPILAVIAAPSFAGSK